MLPSEHVRREVIAAAIEAGGRSRMLDRSRHRDEHIDQILAAVGG